MAAIDITISGVLYDKTQRTTQPVVLIGEASLTGLGVGGGPIQPPAGGGDRPGGIWGPNDPRPTPPIANAPGVGPNPNPPGIWGGPIDPYPGHPLPEPPGKPPEPIQPPVNWKPIWTPTEGWVVVGVINPSIPHPVPSGSPPLAEPKK